MTSTMTKLSAQDKKDLDKYTKFLALKMTQVIVQSRLGDKVCTPCKPKSCGADWFSLAVPDLPDVAAEARRWLCTETGRVRLPHRVEISLRTAEGEKMALENWALSATSDAPLEIGTRVSCTTYNRMGKLLKSLLCVTRATPAYRLSRRQCPQSYALYYRVVAGEWSGPEQLGEGHRCIRVGQVATPAGALQLTVAFRTKMTIAPSQKSLMLDSHHFTASQAPSTDPPSPLSRVPKKPVDLDKPMRVGAFVDVSKVKPFSEPDLVLPEEPPFSWLLEGIEREEELCNEDNTNELRERRDQKQESSDSGREGSDTWTPNEDEDKILEELHFPFASADKCPIAKLANFYRECYHAPILQTFENIETPEVADITEQLELFETSCKEYDEMITSLCETPNNNPKD